MKSRDTNVKKDNLFIVAIDIGILHLGIAYAILNSFPFFFDFVVEGIALVNLTKIINDHHKLMNVTKASCSLYHTNSLTDRLEHFFQAYSDILDSADEILIEYQPIQGLTAVFELIFSKYRHKVTIVYPISVHKHFGMTKGDYEKRKEESQEIASRCKMKDACRQEFDRLVLEAKRNEEKTSETGERAHDVSDAIIMLLYELEKRRKQFIDEEKIRDEKETIAKAKSKFTDEKQVANFFDQFRYKRGDAP